MDNLEKELKRKINIRKFAKEKTGSQEESFSQFTKGDDDRLENLYYLLKENAQAADENSYQNGYWFLAGSKVSVFIKKVIRKLMRIGMGWFINPILARQSHYNGKVVNSINILKDIVYLQQEKIDNIIQQNSILEQKSQDQQKELESLDRIQSEVKQLGIDIDMIKKIINHYIRQIAPELRIELQSKNQGIIEKIDDCILKEKIERLSVSSEAEVKTQLFEITQCFKDIVQQEIMGCNRIERELIVIFCVNYSSTSGMEAIKNEVYDLFHLLQKESIYNVKIVSLESIANEQNNSADIIYVNEEKLDACINDLSPALVIICESTPFYALEYNRLFLKNHTILKLTGQNPLQSISKEIIDELRHCDEYGVHSYLVESQYAYEVMIENGFRNVMLSYPIIDTKRIKFGGNDMIKQCGNIQNNFVIGFASSPMESEQCDDRGFNLLIEIVSQMQDVLFEILWRNETLEIPKLLRDANNCKIILGKYDIKQFYKEIDCVIIPYKTIDNNHACSLSGVEAMLNNLPVISTTVAGISEIVSKYNLGIVCNPTTDDIIQGINKLINNYGEYVGQYKVEEVSKIFNSKQIISFIEDTLENYYPRNFVTLNEWDQLLKQKDKYLVKGHDDIKKYYQNKEVANNYNEVRFLQYPMNYFDAFERASIGIIINSYFDDSNLEILDIASGDGRIVQEDIKYGNCLSIDSSRAMLNIVEERYVSSGKLKTKICDYFVDFMENQFDVITTFRYIRHFDYNQRKLLYQRIYNNLKQGGMLIFDVPSIKYAMKNREAGNWDDFNIYDVFWDEKSIIRELEENNYEVKYFIPIGITSVDEDPVSWTIAAIKK